MNPDLADVVLLDALTGRIAVCAAAALPELNGSWMLTLDGRRAAGGSFRCGAPAAGERREIPLSVDIPPTYPGERIELHVSLNAGPRVVSWTFPLPTYRRKPFPPGPEHTVGIRSDATQAIISGGKLAAVVTASGLRELRHKGVPLIASAMRMQLWRSEKELPESLAELPRMRVSPDRFGATPDCVECHALILPRRMDWDELEFTQRFTPLTAGAIRCEFEFVVPDSFAGIPQLAVGFTPEAGLTRARYFSAAPSGFSESDAPAGRTDFAAWTDAHGAGLLAASAGMPLIVRTSPDESARVEFVCRTAEDGPIAAGRFRMALILAPLTQDDDPVPLARRLQQG
ncbi:MAG: hypothetical protein MR051_09250 [Lentisphaeria bacterium]|nr:hypothetical protein [Lentisphaeria bacterium]